MKSVKGFLLSNVRYGDQDAILHCFTENGFESFFLKNIYSRTSKKKPYLLPLNELNFILNTSGKKFSIQNISSIELVKSIDTTDLRTNTIIFFLSDFLNSVLKKENNVVDVYCEILVLKEELEKRNFRSHLIFMIRLLKIFGLVPLTVKGNFLDPESGSFTDQPLHHYFDENISSVWRKIIETEAAYSVEIPSSDRKKLLDSIIIYYRLHFENFHVPKSLEVVQQIFE